MPDLQDISNAISELQSEAITDIGVLASKKEPPADYNVIAQTTDGFDANLWKDSIFKSKVTRHLCFTKNKQLCQVVVDMKLTDLKECLPEGFSSIQDTMDSHEQALRKERLCVKLVPRHTTETAICDVIIQGKSKHGLASYTYIGELNGLGIWCQLGKITKLQDSANKTLLASTTTCNVGRQVSESLASSPTKKNIVRPDYEHHINNIYTKSAMDDIPFTISNKHVSRSRGEIQPINLLGIIIKSQQEIEEEYNYSFNTEHSSAAF
ncbi:Multivesicular body subunit 12B ESCRT-I complex subunit MVB12B [Triplophysa tibetana]|uniref:Multivesicular body subunit 12B ESCRT-I complex subunit MVB12B n=1 Tax=Triplophysa tibetana TaxID=1572043 RepID=A0A5A9NW92_9TELE|nr:Multivesicular body subunit 12B ESCRT-I complex subunit MVB12B [Triplophysa tibetana]